jgi:hypothetical protein
MGIIKTADVVFVLDVEECRIGLSLVSSSLRVVSTSLKECCVNRLFYISPSSQFAVMQYTCSIRFAGKAFVLDWRYRKIQGFAGAVCSFL